MKTREGIVRSSSDHLRDLARKRDFYAGGLMILLGVGITLKGMTYETGTLTHMGAGFLPTALGILLAFIGLAIVAAASFSSSENDTEADRSFFPESPQWRGWLCILAGPALFIFFGQNFGLMPGTFTCVFVAALGDRESSVKGALILAAIVTAIGVGLFSYVLHASLPILMWRGHL
jgi:putative Ca2+/H+ antiporter (TMEM165/GDT1 family)